MQATDKFIQSYSPRTETLIQCSRSFYQIEGVLYVVILLVTLEFKQGFVVII